LKSRTKQKHLDNELGEIYIYIQLSLVLPYRGSTFLERFNPLKPDHNAQYLSLLYLLIQGGKEWPARKVSLTWKGGGGQQQDPS